MTKILFVTALIVLSISSALANTKACTVGPEYWCKSFQTAEQCGAIRHCTDTVWSTDSNHALADSSTTCQWCERILENTHNGILNLADNDNAIISTLADGCKLLPSGESSSTCANIVNKYGTSVASLFKNKRYTTLCRLMSMCSSESATGNPSVSVGQKRCTWGPAYWCSSLSNSRECNSIDHCSNQIWSRQGIEKKSNDNICQYCEYIIEKLRSIITENKTEVNVEKWLSGACSMLQAKDAVDECVQTMSKYAHEILVLIKNNIDAGVICHLGQMCKQARIVVRVETDEGQSNEKEVPSVPIDEQSRMLCTSIVRATYELYLNQQKSQNDVQLFLKNDCQQLSTPELIHKCRDLVDQRGNDIYRQVMHNKDLSQICDHPDSSADTTAIQSLSQTHCDVCTFVLATAKDMLDAKHSEEKILLYIDEHLCSHLTDETQKNCKYIVETNGKDLIDNIQRKTQPALLCTYFQVCVSKILDGTSSTGKTEMLSFLQENICDHLGPFEDSCHALMEKDTTRLLKTLVNDMEGDVLCQMFGVCPTKMSFIDNLSVNDDKNKCKRCIDDFTRRKHIAEKLLNHSSEFLHHFCDQLPQKDECVKAVDDSMNKLLEFIHSLSPQEICVELKLCDQAALEQIESIQISSSNKFVSQEILTYIKYEICAKLGPLSSLCGQLMDSEGENLFDSISKYIDPHQVCAILDICPTTKSFDNCNDKCECCVSKIENYQVKSASFLQTMLTTANAVCERVSHSAECREMTTGLESIINDIVNRINAKQICQSLTHCSAASQPCDINGDKCTCCQSHLTSRQNNFRTIINEITPVLLSLCTDNDCRSRVQSKQQETLNKINTINSLTLCQRAGSCSTTDSQRSIPFLSALVTKTYSNLDLSETICADFGDLKPICEHLLASAQSARYSNVYMALLKNDETFIDKDLRAQITNTCDACKNAVQTSKDFWINALDSVRNVLLKTCDYCSSKDQCRNYYNQRFDNLKSCLTKIDPKQFCQTIHLCSSTSLANTCSTCVERLQLRKDGVLQGMDRLAGYFTDLCQRYANKQCQTYVKQVHDEVQKTIEAFDPKETCTSIGFCTTDGVENQMDFNQYEKYLENEIQKTICSSLGPFEILCKEVIQGDAEQIQALKIDFDIKDVLQIGNKLTKSLSETDDHDECTKDKCRCCTMRVIQRKRLTRLVGDNIFSALIRSCDYCPARQLCRRHWSVSKARFDCHADRIDSKRVCTHLGFCNTTSVDNITEDIFEKYEETIESEVDEFEPTDHSNSTCILCEYVMNLLSSYINSQSTEQEIEENLQKICYQIPSVLQNQCHEYIDNYGPAIIATLLREFDLSKICPKLNLCTNQMKIDIKHLMKTDVTTCGICDYISTHLHFALQRNSNEKSRQHALATVCSYLSDEQTSRCQAIIQLFSPHIQRLQLGSRNNFCKQLPICETPMIELKPAILIHRKGEDGHVGSLEQSVIDKPMVKVESPFVGSVTQTPACTLCQFVISYLDAIMKNNKSEEAFEEALKKVCTILPNKERAQCDDFVKSYGPVLAELIAEMVDPMTVCRSLNICPDSSVKQPTTVINNILEQTPYTCTICQFIVSKMKQFVGLNQEEKEVLTSLDEACNLFTKDTLREQCKEFIDRHGSFFIQIISNDIEPRPACQRIQICSENYKSLTLATSSSPPISSPIQYGKCVFGMEYWCTSRENAKLCNAVEFCERVVWSKNKNVIN